MKQFWGERYRQYLWYSGAILCSVLSDPISAKGPYVVPEFKPVSATLQGKHLNIFYAFSGPITLRSAQAQSLNTEWQIQLFNKGFANLTSSTKEFACLALENRVACNRV